MLHLRFVLPVMLALLLPALSFAKDENSSIIDSAKRQPFADQAAAVREAMKPGGRFQYLTAQEREAVDKHLDEIAAMLERQKTERFGSDEELDLLQAQEGANAILTRRDGDRLICEKRAPTGSHFKVKKCVTYTEHMKTRMETRQAVNDHLSRPPSSPCNVSAICN